MHAADRAVSAQAQDQRIALSGEDLCHYQGGNEELLMHDSFAGRRKTLRFVSVGEKCD